MDKYIKKAYILIEALPYIRQFYGKTFVIKYGGSIMEDEELKKTIIEDITLLKYVGVNPVIIHGGGPDINRTLKMLNKESEFINGLRVTDRETMEIVEMVLAAKVNKEIVGLINQMRGKAIGICGKDADLIRARKKIFDDSNTDLGFVGEVEDIKPEIIDKLIDDGYIPVIAPVGSDRKGDSYNINADTVAGKIAVALQAEKLIFLTDVDGIRHDPDDAKSRVSSLTINQVYEWIKNERIKGGMLPKVESCVEAVSNGVQRTHILNGLVPHTLLLEIFTDKGIGTMILRKGGN
ncbi:MAG TPA: acetylglutamate kinase [Halanaerobiales bacterium]|nr:acetylglutamate kinase [Halanaerobiales bacterium]